MGKYVCVYKDQTSRGVLYEVKDFSLETIRSMPFYQEEFYSLVFCEGTAVKEDDLSVEEIESSQLFYGYFGTDSDTQSDIDHIKDYKSVKKIVYGKKMSIKEAKKIVLNNPKYKEINGPHSFEIQLKIEEKAQNGDDVPTEEELEDEFESEHFCIFYPPDVFEYCYNNQTFSIEEFDPSIKLDYTKEFARILLQSILGFQYYQTHEKMYKAFKTYFFALLTMEQENLFDTWDELFSTVKFDFSHFGLSNNASNERDTIEFFLNYYKMSSDFSESIKEFFEAYEAFVTQINLDDNKKPGTRA